ncbi:MAG: hypothetical protein J6U35_02035 [Clostridia bacterium]|nr:hypothetical protein [Clostridia bacterium]
MQPNYEQLSLSGETSRIKQTEVECKITAPTDVKSVIAVTGTASSIGEEIVGGEIRYSGRAIFYVLYQSPEGNLEKAECGVEFSDRAEKGDAVSSVKYVVYSVTGEEAVYKNGGYYVQALVTAEIAEGVECDANALVGGDDLLCDYGDVDIMTVVGENKSTMQVEEEFELGYPVKDILTHSAEASVSEVQSGIGAIILDGAVYLSLTIVRGDENGTICKEHRTIPFRLEMDMSAAAPAMSALSVIGVKKSAFKVVVDEEKGASNVIASFDLDAFGRVSEDKTITLVRDAYSVKNEISLSSATARQTCPVGGYIISEKIAGATDFEFDGNSEVVTVVGERAESLTLNAEKNKVTGVIAAVAVEKGEEGYSGKRVILPFELPFNGKTETGYKISASIENFNYRIRGGLDFEATLKINVTEIIDNSFGVVSGIEVGAEKEEKTNAISVYIARGNDTLWDVCKELGMPAEKITALNPEISFPLSGEERIVIYRNL